MTSILVCGACGRMGKSVVSAVLQESELKLVGAVDISAADVKLCTLVPEADPDMVVYGDLKTGLEEAKPDVVVDFTSPNVIYENSKIVLEHGINLVVGTTGLTEEQRNDLDRIAKDKEVGVLVAPNFSLGAVLMMQVSEHIAKYLPNVEIIELHHNRKYDAPSGTARLTAEKINAARSNPPEEDRTKESLAGARGAHLENVTIHSVRLPGFVAHQEVMFGGIGEILTIRHDSLDRGSFMPGVMLACKKVTSQIGLTYGLEHYL